MRFARTLLLLAAFAAPAAAQESAPAPAARRANNAVYVELAGNGLLYSLNYDRMLGRNVSGRVGVTGFAGGDESASSSVIAVPLMVNYLSGTGNHHFEAGVGVLLVSGSAEDLEEVEDGEFAGGVGTGTFGYRYQRPGGGLVFRAGITPFFTTTGFAPWSGVSLGYSF